MAAGSWTVFGPAKRQMVIGGLDIDTHEFRMILVGSGYTPNANTHGTSNDLGANEITGTGYTAGGKLLTMTATDNGSGVTTVDCDDQSWTSSTLTAKYAVIRRQAGGSPDVSDMLLCYCQLETGGAGTVSTTNGTLAVNTTALFTIT